MKLAYSSNAYRTTSLVDAIDRIAALGYRGLELMADVPHIWPGTATERDITSIRRRIAQRGLTLSNVNAFMMTGVGGFLHPSWIEPDRAFRRLRLQHTVDALTMARRLGAGSVTTEPGGPVEEGMSRDEAFEAFAVGLAEVLRHAEHERVDLLIEPEPGLLIENVAQFLQLAERIDSPRFGLNFDIGHFYCVGESLPEAIARLGTWTRHYHIEDIAATRIHEHLIPGHGAIDFASVFRSIAKTGYDGWLTVELYPYLDDPDEAGRAARDHLLRLMPS